MGKEEEEGTEKSVTQKALKGSRPKFVSITVIKGANFRTYMTMKMGRTIHSPGGKWISVFTMTHFILNQYKKSEKHLIRLKLWLRNPFSVTGLEPSSL